MPVAARKSATTEAVPPEAMTEAAAKPVTETASAMKAAASMKASASHARRRLHWCRRANREDR
jgi:hypothetical protein